LIPVERDAVTVAEAAAEAARRAPTWRDAVAVAWDATLDPRRTEV
jgi:hypothetical protein